MERKHLDGSDLQEDSGNASIDIKTRLRMTGPVNNKISRLLPSGGIKLSATAKQAGRGGPAGMTESV